jgi:hypothetical protein
LFIEFSREETLATEHLIEILQIENLRKRARRGVPVDVVASMFVGEKIVGLVRRGFKIVGNSRCKWRLLYDRMKEDFIRAKSMPKERRVLVIGRQKAENILDAVSG